MKVEAQRKEGDSFLLVTFCTEALRPLSYLNVTFIPLKGIWDELYAEEDVELVRC